MRRSLPLPLFPLRWPAVPRPGGRSFAPGATIAGAPLIIQQAFRRLGLRDASVRVE